jgi:Pescadillo N-terminus
MQVLPPDVDMRVMLTFLEFHHALLKFVLFKLYSDLGLRYPPCAAPHMARVSAELASILAELTSGHRSAEEQLQAAGAPLIACALLPCYMHVHYACALRALAAACMCSAVVVRSALGDMVAALCCTSRICSTAPHACAPDEAMCVANQRPGRL